MSRLLHRILRPSPAEAFSNRRDALLVIDTMFRALTGRPPTAGERQAASHELAEGATFDDLVATIEMSEAGVDRAIERIGPAVRSRLRSDFGQGEGASGEAGEPRIVFLHIMKTGGTSLSHLCSEWAGPRRSRMHLFLDDLLTTPAPVLAGYRFIAGHIPYEALELVPRPFQSVTVLREPVARTISHYLDLRRVDPRYGDLTLDEFTSSEVFDVPSGNYQARQLAHRVGVADAWVAFSPYARYKAVGGQADQEYPLQALFDSTPVLLSDDEMLERARANLETLDHVGVTDDLDAVAAPLAAALHAPLREVPRLHVSRPLDATELTDSLRRRIETRTAVDRELYELAARRVGSPERLAE